jgi:hypothetical protein
LEPEIQPAIQEEGAKEPENQRDEKEREKCEKEREDAFKTILSDQAEYDKQLLTLSAGFLAVSLAFIKDVVPLKDAQHLWFLYAAFGLLGACIVLVLASYQFSIWGNNKAKEYWERRCDGDRNAKFPNLHAKLVQAVNIGSGVLFLLGISFLVTFVIWNLNSEARMSMAQDGALMKTPPQGNQIERGAQIKVPPPPPPARLPSPPPPPPRKP